MNKYSAIGLAWLLSLSGAVYYTWDYASAKQAERRLEAVNQALAEQQLKYAEVNKIEKDKNKKLKVVNDTLNADLDELRKRKPRLPEASRLQCRGSTGAELSRDDAKLLAWYAAETEGFKQQLIACQKYAKSLQN